MNASFESVNSLINQWGALYFGNSEVKLALELANERDIEPVLIRSIAITCKGHGDGALEAKMGLCMHISLQEAPNVIALKLFC